MTDQDWLVLAGVLGALVLTVALRVLIGVRFRVSIPAVLVAFGFVFVVGLLGNWWSF